MDIEVAHLREQGVDFAVFNADSRCGTRSGRAELLAQLSAAARRAGLRVGKSALAYERLGRLEFYGTPDLVRFLSTSGWHPYWTHTIVV